jgi:hypothetical protein
VIQLRRERHGRGLLSWMKPALPHSWSPAADLGPGRSISLPLLLSPLRTRGRGRGRERRTLPAARCGGGRRSDGGATWGGELGAVGVECGVFGSLGRTSDLGGLWAGLRASVRPSFSSPNQTKIKIKTKVFSLVHGKVPRIDPLLLSSSQRFISIRRRTDATYYCPTALEKKNSN